MHPACDVALQEQAILLKGVLSWLHRMNVSVVVLVSHPVRMMQGIRTPTGMSTNVHSASIVLKKANNHPAWKLVRQNASISGISMIQKARFLKCLKQGNIKPLYRKRERNHNFISLYNY